jgi:hypothetical protein
VIPPSVAVMDDYASTGTAVLGNTFCHSIVGPFPVDSVCWYKGIDSPELSLMRPMAIRRIDYLLCMDT